MLQLAEFLTNLRALLVTTIQLCYEVRLARYGMLSAISKNLRRFIELHYM